MRSPALPDLEITLGVPFSVHFQAPPAKFKTRFDVLADNTRLASRILQASQPRKLAISARKIDATTSLPLRFANLELTDDEENCNADQAYLMKLARRARMQDRFRKYESAFKKQVCWKCSSFSQKSTTSEKATLIGAMTSHGPPTHNIAQRSKSVNFTQRKNTPSHHVIFKYRTKSALVLEKVLKEDEAGIFEEINGEDVTPLASSSAKAAGKRKAKTEVGGNAVVIFDDDEDVKPIIKKPRSSAGSSEDQAIDLTAF